MGWLFPPRDVFKDFCSTFAPIRKLRNKSLKIVWFLSHSIDAIDAIFCIFNRYVVEGGNKTPILHEHVQAAGEENFLTCHGWTQTIFVNCLRLCEVVRDDAPPGVAACGGRGHAGIRGSLEWDHAGVGDE